MIDAHPWLNRLKYVFSREPQNREQLINLLREAEQRNLLDADALAMIESVLQFSDMQVRDIMIPRSQMVAINESMSLEQYLPMIMESGHSRFPVLNEHEDEVIGILHAKDLLRFNTHTEKRALRNIIRPAIFIPESKKIDILLKEFQSNRNHMGIVVDEYGGIAGFVTIEDIIEQIVGDIEDEFDIDEDAYIKKLSDYKFIIKSHTPIEEFNDYFQTRYSDEEFNTIAGLVVHKFGYLPKRGEKITIDHFKFEVLLADSRRVRLLKAINTHLKAKSTAKSSS